MIYHNPQRRRYCCYRQLWVNWKLERQTGVRPIGWRDFPGISSDCSA